MNIRGMNLNLLPVFDALITEGSVSRAGKRLAMSQPAVSNALAHLRETFGDPLFIRVPSGVSPTARALELAGPIRAALGSLELSLLGGPRFDPKASEHTFVITTTDFTEYVLLPKLLGRLAKEAPRVKLQLRSWPFHRVPESLERGEADVMIGFYRDLPAQHHHDPLFKDEFVAVVRRGHPNVGKRLTLKTYLGLQHVLVTQEGSTLGVVDVALAKRGLSRTIGLRTSHFLMVPSIIAATDMVAAFSVRVAKPCSRDLPLRMFPMPIEVERGTVGQVWHERTHASPAHEWLRAQIRAVAATV